ncbi:hypothetical protein CMQ_4787 [Grosmannia clavigera kw1407]|uniref:Uncharacterized protein n=1 Tax=Grosmannia clavigera (strain kw1407 / UAMH 11150) TaxID=655863 RepID=F0XTX4_GROCL|nr:uncharacterized protein CMQ_4787 [Grosmannia clavigera kw1407]EFW98935.1 hypothetical protein CMQ_4787 [Grosmannia clavigera kw1407]
MQQTISHAGQQPPIVSSLSLSVLDRQTNGLALSRQPHETKGERRNLEQQEGGVLKRRPTRRQRRLVLGWRALLVLGGFGVRLPVWPSGGTESTEHTAT